VTVQVVCTERLGTRRLSLPVDCVCPQERALTSLALVLGAYLLLAGLLCCVLCAVCCVLCVVFSVGPASALSRALSLVVFLERLACGLSYCAGQALGELTDTLRAASKQVDDPATSRNKLIFLILFLYFIRLASSFS
jgi:hypothetical protein